MKAGDCHVKKACFHMRVLYFYSILVRVKREASCDGGAFRGMLPFARLL